MNRDGDPEKAEIVIVRRRVADDAGAGKSGAWKIAYADFVTAMMAFFLVMWLINAANEETRSQVASYFNPIKLTDSSTGARTLKDMKDTHNPQSQRAGETSEGSPPAKKEAQEEAAMIANPPMSLDRVAKTVSDANYRNAGLDSTVEVAPSLKPDKDNPGVGDPFDPRAWERADHPDMVDENLSPDRGARDRIEQSPRKDAGPGGPGAAGKSDSEGLAREIASRLGEAPQQMSRELEVKTTGTGVLVSLTESADFEMFKTGSAEPKPEMLKLVEALAGALKAHPGNIIIRGHTDSRPYRNRYYDNWQLSTARANLARYMLIRGGLDASRIRRVEGVADLEPKNLQDPQAPENRRIEIFVDQAAH